MTTGNFAAKAARPRSMTVRRRPAALMAHGAGGPLVPGQRTSDRPAHREDPAKPTRNQIRGATSSAHVVSSVEHLDGCGLKGLFSIRCATATAAFFIPRRRAVRKNNDARKQSSVRAAAQALCTRRLPLHSGRPCACVRKNASRRSRHCMDTNPPNWLNDLPSETGSAPTKSLPAR
jgi:hypothetical protein